MAKKTYSVSVSYLIFPCATHTCNKAGFITLSNPSQFLCHSVFAHATVETVFNGVNLDVVKDHIAMARIILFITKVAFRALAPARVND